MKTRKTLPGVFSPPPCSGSFSRASTRQRPRSGPVSGWLSNASPPVSTPPPTGKNAAGNRVRASRGTGRYRRISGTGFRARMAAPVVHPRHRLVSADEIMETFSLAPAGQDFEVYTVARLKRVKRSPGDSFKPTALRFGGAVQALRKLAERTPEVQFREISFSIPISRRTEVTIAPGE